MFASLQEQVNAGATAEIVVRLEHPLDSLRIGYSGLPGTFLIEAMQIGRDSCFAAPGSIAAETLALDWSGRFKRGTEIRMLVRNIGATRETFVAPMIGT